MSSTAASTPRFTPTKCSSMARRRRSSKVSAVIHDLAAGTPQRVYEGGKIDGGTMLSARWDLLPQGRYMMASVQTVRGCPKHCSFCSVWRTDGQKPRVRSSDALIEEMVSLR